jgi:hypothetical protein
MGDTISSILSTKEQDELRALSSLVRKMRIQNLYNDFIIINPCEIDEIRQRILAPCHCIGERGPGEFALDLIGWYTPDLSYPVLWSKAVPAHWAANLRGETVERGKWFCLQSWRRFKLTMEEVFPNQEVEDVLDGAMKSCWQRNVIDEIGRGWLYYPLREGYHTLWFHLSSGCGWLHPVATCAAEAQSGMDVSCRECAKPRRNYAKKVEQVDELTSRPKDEFQRFMDGCEKSIERIQELSDQWPPP